MPRTSASSSNIGSLVNEFVGRLVAAIEAETASRMQQAIVSVLGANGVRRRPGRPPKAAAAFALAVSAPRKARPKQLCPVPGCQNPAAPVFGMVCAAHKGISKAKIKKYREQRRAKKP